MEKKLAVFVSEVETILLRKNLRYKNFVSVALKDEFQSVLRNLRPAMFVSLTRRKVNTAKIKILGQTYLFLHY